MPGDAADELAEDEDDVNERWEFLSQLPASAQWMAQLHGKFRSFGRVKTSLEWEYFKANIINFQGRGSNEADNHSAYQFSAFAESWNEWVDSLKYDHVEVTYKTASQLKDAMKSMKRREICNSTLWEHSTGLNKLREMHTNTDRNQ